MSDKDQKAVAVVREMVQAWNDQNWDKVGELFAPDGVLHSMMLDPIVGREPVASRIKALGAGVSWIELELEHIGVIDGRVYIERKDRFIYNGKRGDVPVMGVLVINDDGLVQLWRDYYDRAQLLSEMGVDDFSH